MGGDCSFDVWSDECRVRSVLFEEDFGLGDVCLPDGTNYAYVLYHHDVNVASLGIKVDNARDLFVTVFTSADGRPYIPSLERLAFEACDVLKADRVVVDFAFTDLGDWVDSRDSLFARDGDGRFVLEHSDCAGYVAGLRNTCGA